MAEAHPTLVLPVLFTQAHFPGSRGTLLVVHFWPSSDRMMKCIRSGRQLVGSLLMTERPLESRSNVCNFT